MKYVISILVILTIGIVAGLLIRSEMAVTSMFSTKASKARVFSLLNDFEAIPTWNSSVLSSTIVSAKTGIGCKFIEKRKELFRVRNMSFTVLQFIPDTYLKVEGKSSQSTILFEYSIQTRNGQSFVQLRFTETPKPFLFAKLLLPTYQRHIDANMRTLKSLIEN